MAGARCPFELCDGDGLVIDAETNTAYNCRCRPQRIAQARARNLAGLIPRRFQGASFDRAPVTDIEPQATVAATRRFVSTLEEQLESGRGLCFTGPVGTGKTTLAMLVSKAALDAGRSVAIYPLPKLLSLIRDSFSAERSYLALAEELATVELLQIDDVGAERSTEWVLEELYSIVNSRYEDQRSIIFTTNIDSPAELAAQIGQRTVSRLTEMCEALPVLGRDRRMDLRVA